MSMNLQNPGNFRTRVVPRKPKQQMFKDFDATELYCPKCKRAVPVRKRLLLVLSEGDKYEYLCSFCSELVGIKFDRHEQQVKLVIAH